MLLPLQKAQEKHKRTVPNRPLSCGDVWAAQGGRHSPLMELKRTQSQAEPSEQRFWDYCMENTTIIWCWAPLTSHWWSAPSAFSYYYFHSEANAQRRPRNSVWSSVWLKSEKCCMAPELGLNPTRRSEKKKGSLHLNDLVQPRLRAGLPWRTHAFQALCESSACSSQFRLHSPVRKDIQSWILSSPKHFLQKVFKNTRC